VKRRKGTLLGLPGGKGNVDFRGKVQQKKSENEEDEDEENSKK
jgi:hypothetical protein